MSVEQLQADENLGRLNVTLNFARLRCISSTLRFDSVVVTRRV